MVYNEIKIAIVTVPYVILYTRQKMQGEQYPVPLCKDNPYRSRGELRFGETTKRRNDEVVFNRGPMLFWINTKGNLRPCFLKTSMAATPAAVGICLNVRLADGIAMQ